MIQKNSQIVQAFPATPTTYVGTPTGFNPKGYGILHVAEDCDVTFDFGTMGTVTFSATAGQDFAFSDEHCQAITSTGTVWIS